MGDSLDQEFTNLIADANLDPRPIYARLRDEAPVYRTPLDFWYVTSYEAAKEVARDAGAFSSDPNNGAGAVDTSGRPATMPDSPAIQLLRRLVLFVDPPDHTRLRKLVSRVFTANRTLTRRGFIDEVIQM